MLKLDCKYFTGDKPCKYNKEQGIICEDCTYYDMIKLKILIVKLDAIGDVLRTTSILPPLKKKYMDAHITWCTRSNAKALFDNNQYVNDVILVEDDAFYRINTETYDLVINLDTSKLSSSIAAMAKSNKKIGFILNEKGYVEPISDSANEWLEMSAFDSFKKANQKSYQQIMYDILKFDFPVATPIINIKKEINQRALQKLNNLEFELTKKTIGLNIGVGTKWPSKGWPIYKWKKLIEILEKKNLNIILLGGPEERQMLKEISENYDFVIDSGSNNSLLEFAAIVDLCDVLVTADSLALHIGTALNKHIIALFGPTSSSEIYLFGKGEKIISPKVCNCYYRKYCTEDISCMAKINPEIVAKAIDSFLVSIKN